MMALNHLLFHLSFIPHGHCYLWKPELVGLHFTSDLLIALAYYSIPALLIYFVRKREDLPFSGIFLLFSAFIISCGSTHLVEVWTLWHPDYWFAGFLKAITAIVSLYTAAELITLIPLALALPSPAQLETANQALMVEVAERQRAEVALQQAKLVLESSVEERTAELKQTNEQLLQEICERQRVELSLRDAIAKLTLHFENTPLAVIEWDSDFRVLRWSPAAEKIFGWKAEEVLNRPASDPKFLFAGVASVVSEIQETLRAEHHESQSISHLHNYTKSGTAVHCEWYNSALYSEAGELTSVLSLVLDITERDSFWEALRQSEERFRIAAECASDLIYEWDIQSDIMLWFGRIDEHLNCTQTECPNTATTWRQMIHPDDRERVEQAIRQHLQTQTPFFEEYRIQRSDGSFLDWIDRGTAVFNEQGTAYKWIGVTSDISDRKQAEKERTLALAREQAARHLAEAKERDLRTLAEAIPQMVWSARPDGSFDYFNQRWLEYTGLTADQSQGWGWQKTLHPEDLQKCLERWQSVLQGGGDYEIEARFRRSDGTYRWHLGRAMPVREAAGQIVKWFGTCTDIDDQKRSQEGAYFLAAAVALLASSLDYETTLQRLADLAVPKLGDWCCVHLVEPDGSIRLLAVAHADPQKAQLMWEIEQRHPIDPQGRHGVAKVLRTGESKVYSDIPDSVLAAVAPSAEWLRILREYESLATMCVPLIARGRTLGVISLVAGESGRRYARADLGLAENLAHQAATAIDNARLYSEAQEANRLKDEFLATLSHELRTPINAILGWAQILQQRKLSQEKTVVALETIERNARLQAQMIEDLLDVSRIVGGKLTLKCRPIELLPTLEAALETVRPAAEAKKIQLVSVWEADDPLVWGDSSRLQQVLWNLLSKAVKFTPNGGRVEVRLSVEAGHEGERMVESAYVLVQVRDSGIGINPKFLPFVFERFRQADSSSTRSYSGLGLGLAIVRHLVELHGGSVRAMSLGEGQGAIFTVQLPLWQGERTGLISSGGNSGLNGTSLLRPEMLQGLRVLLVEDETDTRDLLVAVLRQYGVQVTATASVSAAMRVFQVCQPDVLVSDIAMPEEDGYSLIRQVRALPPEIGGKVPAMALTAMASEKDRQQALAAGFTLYMAKPITPMELATAIAQLAGRLTVNR